jgi:hypothetical protein
LVGSRQTTRSFRVGYFLSIVAGVPLL